VGYFLCALVNGRDINPILPLADMTCIVSSDWFMANVKLTLNKVKRKEQHLLGLSNKEILAILATEVPSAFLVKLRFSDTNILATEVI
jgi:hypothetical protein